MPDIAIPQFLSKPSHFVARTTVGFVKDFLYSLGNIFALGLFGSSSIALVVHKVTIILLHRPLSAILIILFSPFLFGFDFLTLFLIHRGLSCRHRISQLAGTVLCFSIICCSATFVSFYIETGATLNWGRSLEVYPV
jgi:hypothetical protein